MRSCLTCVALRAEPWQRACLRCVALRCCELPLPRAPPHGLPTASTHFLLRLQHYAHVDASIRAGHDADVADAPPSLSFRTFPALLSDLATRLYPPPASIGGDAPEVGLSRQRFMRKHVVPFSNALLAREAAEGEAGLAEGGAGAGAAAPEGAVSAAVAPPASAPAEGGSGGHDEGGADADAGAGTV